MKRIRVVVFVALAAVLTSALPTEAGQAGGAVAEPASSTPVASLEGEGFWGSLACYSCLGVAISTTGYAAYLTDVGMNACLSLCDLVL